MTKAQKINLSGKLVIFSALIGCLTTAPALADDVVSTSQQTFTVKFSDGSTEKHVVRYQAMIAKSHFQTGGPSTMFHPIDNRQCHWSIQTYVQRDIGILDHTGQVGWRDDWRQIFNNVTTNRAPGLGIKTGFQGVNCGTAAPQIAQEVSGDEANVKTQLPVIMSNDRAEVAKEVQGDGQVINVQ